MASVSLQLRSVIKPAWSDTSDTFNPISQNPSIDAGLALTYAASPSAATHMNRLYSKTLTFTGTTPQSIDLDATTVDKLDSSTGSFAAAKYVYLCNTSESSDIVVSGDWFTSLFPSCTGLTLKPGMSFQLARPDTTGMAVTATSADVITFTPTAGGTLQVVIAGKGPYV